MKKYTVSLMLLSLFIFGLNSVYATDDVIEDDSTEYGAGPFLRFYAITYDGRPTYNVAGVSVDLYYKENGLFKKLSSLYSEYEGVTFTSDEDGIVYFGNLPLGLYKYVVSDIPYNMVVEGESIGTFAIIEQSLSTEIDIYLKDNAIVPDEEEYFPEAEIPPQTETPPAVEEKVEENDTLEVEDEIKFPDIELKPEFSPTEEQIEVLGTFYEDAKEEFVPKEEANVDVEDIPVTKTIPMRIQMSKSDVITAMKNIRITDQIRLSITMDTHSMQEYIRVAYLPKRVPKTKKA